MTLHLLNIDGNKGSEGQMAGSSTSSLTLQKNAGLKKVPSLLLFASAEEVLLFKKPDGLSL